VVWVDRADMDAMLEETALTASSDSSAVAIGRLLKADLLIHGRYTAAHWDVTNEGQAYRRHLIFEVTDLNNASILASADLPLNSLGNDGSDLDPDILAQCAHTARRLLAEAQKVRKRNVSGIALAPLFFTNSGASPRLDSWDQALIDRFTDISSSFPSTTILHFRGTGAASQEEELSLLGLTDADPNIWQKAAKGYIWGSYHELAPGKTTAFEDIQVEAELYLEMGGQPPQRFTRTFAVKDFDRQSRSMVTDILRTAIAEKQVAPSAETGQQMGSAIFDHLCDSINAGFFSRTPDVPALVPSGGVITTGRTVVDPVARLPYGGAKLNYCGRMLDVACFFDPLNSRMRLLRALLTAKPGVDPGQVPGDELNIPSECVDNLRRLIREPDYNQALYASAVEYVMNRCVTKMGERFQFLAWRTSSDYSPALGSGVGLSPRLPDERAALLSDFYPLLVAQTPVMVRQLAQMGALEKGQSNAAGWLRALLTSDAKPEIKFQYFQAVWPLLADYYWKDLGPNVEQLMKELGDRRRVEAVLMKTAAPSPTPTPEQAQASPVPSPAAPTPAPVTQRFHSIPATPDLFQEPMLAGVSGTDVPPAQGVSIPWDRIKALTEDSIFAQYDHTPEPDATGMDEDESEIPIASIEGFGDQLILKFTVGGPGPGWSPAAYSSWCSYRISTGQIDLIGPRPLRPRNPQMLNLTPGGHALYIGDGVVGALDLLSGSSDEFPSDQGLPVQVPSMLGYGGDRYGAVAEDSQRVVGLYDWSRNQWLTPSSPPAAPPDVSQHPFKVPDLPIVGTNNMLIFPHWDLFYDTAKHAWNAIPPQPAEKEPLFTAGLLPILNAGTLALDGDIWRWDVNGILDYSPAQGRIVWQAAASHLIAVAADGPYLWLSFVTLGRSDSSYFPHYTGTLLLLDRASHRALGVINLPDPGRAMYIDGHQFWLADWRLNCWEKNDLYATLGVPAPQPSKTEARPSRPGSAGDAVALYDAMLRGDLPAVRRILRKPGVADAVIGPNHVPALSVAVWTRNTDMLNLFLAHHPNLEAVPTIEVPNADSPDFSPPAFQKTEATPLVAAALLRDPAMTQLLLKAGARPVNAAFLEALKHRNGDAMELLVKAGAPLTGAADWILKEKDADMATRLLAANPHLSPTDWASIEQYARPQDVKLPPAVAADPSRVGSLITTALQNHDEARAIALTRYLTPAGAQADARADGLQNCFISALQFGSAKVVEMLLSDGVSPQPAADQSGPGGLVPLDVAIAYPDVVLALLHHGAKPRLFDYGDSLYAERLVASLSGTAVLTEILKDYPDLKTRHGYGTLGGTLLCAAAGQWPDPSSFEMVAGTADRIKMVELLLSMGVSINERGRDGFTAMHAACGWHDAEMACLLAGHGADLHARDLAGRTLLDAPYVSYGGNYGFLETVENLQPASEIEKLGKNRLLAAIHARPALSDLRAAVSANDLGRVKDLLNRDAYLVPPEDQSHQDDAPAPGLVYIAVTHGARDMAETLLDHGCDPNIGIQGVEGWYDQPEPYNGGGKQNVQGCPRLIPYDQCKTPLIAAAAAGDLEMVKLLLKHGAYAPTQDEFHRDAIEAAATPQIAQFIRENTTVQYAAQKLFETLDDRSMSDDAKSAIYRRIAATDPKAFLVRNVEGLTPLTYPIRAMAEMMTAPPGDNAMDYGTYAAFHQCGVKLAGLDDFGMTPLHEAVLYGRVNEVAALVKAGFDPATPDIRGITALDLAQGILDDANRADVVNALRSGM